MEVFLPLGHLCGAGRWIRSCGFSGKNRWGFSTGFILKIANSGRRLSSLAKSDAERLANIRNVGISAHIDSGKTTLTERILYYTGRIPEIHEVRGKDKVGAKMDSMELEREKGITIKSAATYTTWKGININIIDTPGHIDFTFEVERSLRVLDSCILVICAAGGVQSQTITVNKQMSRYKVPRVCFINKMDRPGSNVNRAVSQLEKLGLNPIQLQIPIGAESDFKGVVDVIKMKSYYNEGPNGAHLREEEVPSELLSAAKQARVMLVEFLAEIDDEFADIFLEREPLEEQIVGAIRRCTISLKAVPIIMGSALHNKGVQLLLDAINMYCASPKDIKNYALDLSKNEEKFEIVPSSDSSVICLAFKLEDGAHGQLTYVRTYQGTLEKGCILTNTRNMKKVRVGRLVRMHSDEMVDVQRIYPGEICALFGVDCASGDTFTSGELWAMSSIYVPPPVVSLSLNVDRKQSGKLMKALNKFQKEDLTFKVNFNPETNTTSISGMGELHLDIYLERIKREYNIECQTGKPQVSFKETILSKQQFSYTHKKQTGGSGQFAKLEGYIEQIDPANLDQEPVFVNQIRGNAIDAQYISSICKGMEIACKASPLAGYPIVGMRFVLLDGKTHAVDSSEMAFTYATTCAIRKAFLEAKTALLEPIMQVCISAPNEHQAALSSFIAKNRGEITDIGFQDSQTDIYADIPLSEMFGANKEISSLTHGSGTFTMEYKNHKIAPRHLSEEVITSRADYTRSSMRL